MSATACRQARHTRVHRAGSRQAAIKCPSWCEVDHDIDPDGSHDGPIWPEVPSISLKPDVNCSVTVSAGLDTDGSTLLFLDVNRPDHGDEGEGLSSMLTSEQAREVGLALLSAASWAKDHQIA